MTSGYALSRGIGQTVNNGYFLSAGIGTVVEQIIEILSIFLALRHLVVREVKGQFVLELGPLHK